MRLKSIKLAGFKSFVDPTTVAFPTNMSAIVGPNGCGKSNIIDAVRWVMGESSAKNLRGESMADVIFNGSTNRKPVGQASIELLFDNSEGKLGGEYASFAEIGIKRKVERDGQSEYYLNGTKCRRRDITDIFLGTGLGPRSYAIIEQGMISKLIEAKPDDLRIFVEEAAGISKYKERRRETENRMRRTQENLERLTDLREELERQLQHLQRQAQAAERYTELKQEERQLKAELQALQWKALDEQVNDREAAIRDLEVRLEQVLAEQQSIDTDIIKLRESQTDQNDAFNEVQGRFYAIGGEISRAEQSIKFITDRSRQLSEDLRQVDINLAQAKSHLEEDYRKQQQWKEELAGIEPELNILAEREGQSADTLAAAEEAMMDWQQRWDDFNQTAAKPRQIAEVQQSRIQHLEQALNRLQDRVAKLDDEKNQLVAGDVEDELSLLNEQLAESELSQEQQLEQEQQLKDAIVARREQLDTVTQQLNQSTGRRQELRGKQASLEALQEAALGKSRGAVDSWLESRGLGQGKRIAETLRVATGWEQAVETALGDYLQAVCVDGLDSVANYLSELSSGSLSLLDTTSAKVSASNNSLLNKIESGSDAVSALLANVLAADDLASAMAMRSSLSAGQSVMTRDGIWLGSNWLRVNREKDPQAGVIARQQELETLAAELEAIEETLEKFTAEQADLRRALQDAEQSRDQVAQDLRQSNQRVGQLRSEISARQARIEQLLVRRERLNHDISDAREQFHIEQENLGEARLLLQEAIDAMEKDANQREQLLAERDRNRSVLDQARQQARHDKDTAHQLAIRSETLRTQLDTIVNAITRLAEQQEQYSLRREELQEALLTNDDPVEELKMQLETQLEKRLGVEDELQKARLLKEDVEEKLRHSEHQRSTVDQRVQQVRIALEHERLQNQTLTVQRETVMEQLLSAKFELDAVLATLPEEANHSEWQEKLDSIDRRIQRLGAINLAAIEEYKSQAERKHYLDAQNEDLVEALTTLENAIRKIDKETRGRFKETFDLINSGFGELFPKIFGGGNAYLEMTGDDLLDTGVSIMARPPGKKNSTIHLLSGGEKALTAIALVFSIFRLNPAPFCILDEVDAPLDDVNVGRYVRMVKEMSEKVQFIYITHNKIPMEYASHLLGVTMQEPGVSRLVTVNVEEAAEMALA